MTEAHAAVLLSLERSLAVLVRAVARLTAPTRATGEASSTFPGRTTGALILTPDSGAKILDEEPGSESGGVAAAAEQHSVSGLYLAADEGYGT